MAETENLASEERPGLDPVVPQDTLHDVPGTEAGVLAELGGTTRFQGYIQGGLIKKANRMKNAGINGAMPPWTLVDYGKEGAVHFRFIHFEVGMISSIQSREAEDVRIALSWPKTEPLPIWGSIETNARTMMHAIVECTKGTEVDLLGAAKANEIRNAGIVYAFPSDLLGGLRLRILHMGHPWLHVVRSDAEKFLREAIGIKPGGDLPAEADTEVERFMMIASVVGCVAGRWVIDGKEHQGMKCAHKNGNIYYVDLKELFDSDGIEALRRWLVSEAMPAAVLAGKVPAKREDQVVYFREMFAEHNPDVLRSFREAHRVIRTVTNEKLLSDRGFVAGADWERESRDVISYEPAKDTLVDLKSMDQRDLSTTLREHLFPKINLHQSVPDHGSARENHFLSTYSRFNNGALEEMLNRENEIRGADHELILGKDGGYVAGLAEASASVD